MEPVPGGCVVGVQPYVPGGFEHGIRADDIGIDECPWPGDRTVDVRFGGEVHDRIDRFLTQQLRGQCGVTDIALDEAETWRLKDRVQTRQVPGVRERIEDDDGIVRVLFDPVLHEIRADKSCASGDEQTRHRVP